MKKILLLLPLLFSLSFIHAQERYTISGYARDASTGEDLIAANIYNKANPQQGTESNVYGFFSLTLPEGNYDIVCSYMGFSDKEIKINLLQDTTITILMDEGISIEEIVVTAEASDVNVQSTEMGTVSLDINDIKRLPALLGEVDVLKTIQLLPGVLSAGEGNAGFYVRGGGPDQNLVLLDEAVVYNSGHLLGFFSVFNADAIKNTTLIKGGMPAKYGGRLSSVLDIQMKEGNNQYYSLEGGIGLIASRLTAQGPIVKDKASFIVSGRRTYAFELASPFLEDSNLAGTSYYFYDLNAKVNWKISDKDRIFFSTYLGDDILNFQSNERDFKISIPYGNFTSTLRWNHLFSNKLFMNMSVIYNDYDFRVDFSQQGFSANVISGVRDWGGKLDFDYIPNDRHTIRFGFHYTHHRLTPQTITAFSEEVEFTNDANPKYAHETGTYIQDEWEISDALSINVGLRFSTFTQVGPYTSKEDGTIYASGAPVVTYTGLEPRASLRFKVDAFSSIKAGFSRANQYIHLVSNSTSTLPNDVWVPSTERIAPQIANQYALGYFRNFFDNNYESSIEVYYKALDNQIDYQENYVNDPSFDPEDSFVFGEGWAYGVEFFLKKRKGDLTGWIGYTWSKTARKFPDINDGKVFPAVYDRTNDLSVVLNYRLSDKWDFGTVFVYGTGSTYTPVESFYFIENTLNTEYGVRNSQRLPDYHRIDVSATYNPTKNSKKNFSSFWTFSIYNVYNRRNVFFIYYFPETDPSTGSAEINAYKVSLFPIIPSVTWNFKWNIKRNKVLEDVF